MVQDARRSLASQMSRFAYAAIDAQSIPFENGRFDAVLANHVLFHVPDRARALQEIRRVLKPEGRFYATTIGPEHMIQMEALVKLVEPEAAIWTEQLRATFNLENGREELRGYFPIVSVDRYEDSLIITEVEPLIAYILSSTRFGVAYQGSDGEVDKLRRSLVSQIRSNGPISIDKDSGLFIASR
jgi:ubiquinone/menaquinone biosynthesis C-methylase UbiE